MKGKTLRHQCDAGKQMEIMLSQVLEGVSVPWMVLASCSFSRLSKEIENETHGGWWQQKTRTWNLHLLGDYIQMLFAVEFTSFGEVLSRGELFLLDRLVQPLQEERNTSKSLPPC